MWRHGGGGPPVVVEVVLLSVDADGGDVGKKFFLVTNIIICLNESV